MFLVFIPLAYFLVLEHPAHDRWSAGEPFWRKTKAGDKDKIIITTEASCSSASIYCLSSNKVLSYRPSLTRQKLKNGLKTFA